MQDDNNNENAIRNNDSEEQHNNHRWVNYTDPDDAPSVGFGILSFLFPLIGIILFFAWIGVRPQKARSCIKGAFFYYAIVILLIIIHACVNSSQ